MANKKAKFTGFNNINKPFFSFVSNEQVPWRLETVDGQYIADVSWGFIDAIQNKKLDSYKPKDNEVEALNKYKSIPQFELDLGEENKQNNKVSYNALKAIEGYTLDSYTPSKEEEKALEAFRSLRNIPVYDEAKRKIGSISYDANVAYQNFKLDEYKPKDEGEKNVIANLRKEAVIPLEVEVDGKKKSFGNISYDAYMGLKNNNIDESKLSEADKGAISNYLKAPIFQLKLTVDGKDKVFGNVSLNTLKEMDSKEFSYDAIPENERQAVSDYFEYIDDNDGYEEPDSFLDYLSAIPYTVEKIAAGAIGGIEDLGYAGAAFLSNLGAKGARLFDKIMPGDTPFLSNHFDNTTKEILATETVGEKISKDAESRFAVPDWYRQYVGNTAEAFGGLLPAMATEYLTAGASPFGDMALAKLTTSATAKKTLVNTIKTSIKTSDLVFGGSAMGSAARRAYAQTGDVDKSLNYGILNGIGEVLTEKLFGGIGGTGVGADDALINLSKIKGVSKLASTKLGGKVLNIALEGVEEMIMTDLDPWMQRATINPDAKKATWKERGESYLQGVLLSSFSNAATYSFTKVKNIPTIKELNVITQNINDTLPDGVSKLSPLKVTASNEKIEARANEINRINGINIVNSASSAINEIMKNDQFELLTYDATTEEITERQNQIKVFSNAYADLTISELVKNNPEAFAEIISVGDVFKDAKTGNIVTVTSRDAKSTTVQINNGEKAETRVIPNSKALEFFTNGQLVWVNPAKSTTTDSSTTTATEGVSIGDQFIDKSTGQPLKVIDRTADKTTVSIQTSTGIRVKPMSNADFDAVMARGQLERVATEESTPSVADTTEVTAKAEEPIRDINLKRVGRFYEAYGEDALLLAEALDGVETTKAVVNGVETDVLRLPADLAEKAVSAYADEFNLILSDKPTSTEVENAAVTDETTTSDESIPAEEESATEVEISDVANAIEETLTEQAKADLQNGEVKDNYIRIAETLVEVYKADGTIEAFAGFFVDGGKKVEATISGEADNSVEVLKNESTSDTIESRSETTPVESEDNGNEQRRKGLLHDDGKRGNNESSGEHGRDILSDGRQNDGKTATERQSIARQLIERGQTEEVTIENNKITLVNFDAYNNEMLYWVDKAKNKGVTLRFFVGKGTAIITGKDGTQWQKSIDGVKINSKEIYLQYDANRSLETLYKHETSHAMWTTAEMQKVKDTILNSLTEEEKQGILSQERYQMYIDAYLKHYNGDTDATMDAVWEEFVCDVNSGLNDYTSKFNDVVTEYWGENETTDTYKVAEYSESIDAGGEARYSLGDVKFSEKPFDEQVDSVLSGEDTVSTHLRVSEHTPKLLLDLGLNDKPILITSVHTKTALGHKVRNKNTHYISTEVFKKLPQLVESPAIVMESTKKGSIVMFVNALDENNNPVVCSIKIDGKGNYNNVEVEANVVTSVYGKDTNPTGFIEKAVEDNRVLYWNKKMSQELFDTPGLQLPDNINTLDSNVIIRKISDNVNTKISNTDSNGRELTKGQAEYFKDSKERDENGNLRVMYRGDAENITVFDRKKSKYSNLYGRGFYFTNSEEHAKQYGDLKSYYLDIKHPVSTTETTITKSQLKKFLQVVSENEDYGLDNYGYDATVDSVLQSTYGKSDFLMLYDISQTAIGDLVEAIELFNEVNGTDFDGIILDTETVIFNSEQAKLTSNEKPTTNPDIRYDLDDTDTEYMKAVESGDTETVAKMIEDAAEKSFPNSKVRGDDGKLKLVYHGRVSDFNVFDRQFANIEGDFGKGYYFTSNEYDVDANYANEEGPDLKNKIDRYAEQLEYNEEYEDLSYEEREEIARQKFITSEPNTITAYLNMENPVYITPDGKGTFLVFNEAYDEEYDEYGEPEGLFVDFIEALKNNSYDYAYNDVDFSFLYEYAYDNGGMYAADAVKTIKNRIIVELSDDEGNIATNEVIRLAFEEIGFDGIIDTSVYYKFKNMDGMDSGTTHYIVFDSEQIKSADLVTYDDNGNVIPLSERFNKNNKDIRYDLDEDSDGNTLTEEQVDFFKDSQARDKDGKLKVLYHGSPNEFDVFDKNKNGKRGAFASAKLGFYFTDDITYAKMMGNTSDKKANVFKAYLNIRNPLRVLTTELFDEEGVAEIEKQLKGGNYDGIIDELGNYVVFESNQIKLTDNTKPTESDNIRYDLSEPDKLETQKKIEKIAKEINTHDELIEIAKKNTQEFVDKIKENKSLQKRLDNAKRQTLLSPKPIINVAQVGKVTKDILKEMDSTLKATDLKDEIISIYTEYFDSMKKASGVESKVQEANDNMMKRFANLAIDIAESAEAYAESEEYLSLKAYLKDVRIKVPDHAKGEAHFGEFRKSHMGTFNLTNDGLDIDTVYQELCEMFPGMFDVEVANAVDQLYAIADKVEALKPYAYNPHLEYMADAVDHIVYRFASEVDGIAATPKTKAQKIAEKGAYDKEMALEKERASFERKLDRHKKNSEKTIQALQKKIGDSEYVRYWEKRLSKEEKAQAVNKVRERQKVAVLKTKIRNIVADMKKKLDKTEKNGGYPKELVKAVADVCSVIDFHTDRTNKDGTPTKASLKLDALKMQYDSLKNSPNYDFQTEYSEDISNRILNLHQKIENKRVIDLTFDELSQLKDILGEINHSLATASEQIGKANTKANFEIATDIIDDLKSNNKAISEFKNSLLREMKLAKEKGKAFTINPHRIFEMLSNYDKNSALWQLYDQINRGARASKKFTMDATLPFDELTNGGGNEIAFYEFRTKLHKTGIKFEDGTEVEIPKSIICEIVMLWDRKQGRTHLEAGGFKIPDLKLFNKGQTAESLAVGKKTNAITQADITRLKGMLDSYDKAWIERSRHLFNNVAKNAINETSMQLLGREIAKADNYIRIYVDSDFVNKDIGKNENDITIEGHGSLKETTPDAKNPVVLRGLHENVFEHIDFASRYYGLAIPIRNFNKVYKISIKDGDSSQSIRSVLGSTFGPKIRDGVVVQVIKDLQSPRPREISMFNRVRGKWLTSVFWGNIKSTLKQTASYWTSSSILDESSLIKGLGSYFKHRKQTKAEIAKYSGTLYNRSQGLSTTELGDRANRKRLAGLSSKTTKFINEKLPVLRKVPEWIRPGNWLQSMDCATSSALWDACKHQVSKTMNASEDGYMKAVADLYERVIEETQSNYDMLHRPEILKSTNPVNQTLGMFQNDNLQQTGIMYGAFNNLRAKQKAYKADKSSVNEQNLKDAKKRMDKAIRSRIYSSMWLVLVSTLGDALLRKFKPYIDDEDKEITSSSVLEQAMLNMAEDTFGIFVPVYGQLVTKAVDTFNEGYDFLNDPSFDVMEDFIKATSKIWDAYAEDGDVLKALVDAVPAISNMTGIPAKNISDLYKSVKGYMGDIKAGEFAHDLEDYTSGNKSFYNYGDLASYIVSGNAEKETKWNEYYSANGKEFAKGSLTKEIKPAYVQMYIDFPEKAYNIKKKLVLDYDYAEADIDGWLMDEYLKHIVPGKKFADKTVSNPEYAAEIKDVLSKENKWNATWVFKAIRSYYKAVYKDGDEKETKALREALLDDGVVTKANLDVWENQADTEIKKQEYELAKEKAKFEY